MQKRHRIFIAINLPQDIKEILAGYEKKWPELPAKWVNADNLHITLIFLGDLTDIELGEVCVIVKNVSEKHKSFNINLNKVAYGPDNKIPPRMIWASGDKVKELSLLKEDLEESLLQKVRFVPENRGFTPHITLARISDFQWRAIEPEERPDVNEIIDLNFFVESIEVMSSSARSRFEGSSSARSQFEGESVFKKSGPEYTIIESFSLI